MKEPITVRLVPERLDEIFRDSPDHEEALCRIYELIYPNGLASKIRQMRSHITCNQHTYRNLKERFLAFDKRVHPDRNAGEYWASNGFSTMKGDHLHFMHVHQAQYDLKDGTQVREKVLQLVE